MSKDADPGEESSKQWRQPVQKPCGIRTPVVFRVLKKAGAVGTEFEVCRG